MFCDFAYLRIALPIAVGVYPKSAWALKRRTPFVRSRSACRYPARRRLLLWVGLVFSSMALPPFLVFFARTEKEVKTKIWLSRTWLLHRLYLFFLGLAVLFITQLDWRCTQTKPVIFLDNSAQFPYSAVLCQDLPILYQDLSVLATLISCYEQYTS